MFVMTTYFAASVFIEPVTTITTAILNWKGVQAIDRLQTSTSITDTMNYEAMANISYSKLLPSTHYKSTTKV